MWETWVRYLDWEDPLQKGKATRSSILAWRIPGTVLVHGVSESRTGLSAFHFHFHLIPCTQCSDWVHSWLGAIVILIYYLIKFT